MNIANIASSDRENNNEVFIIRPSERQRFKLTIELPILILVFSSALTDGVTYNLLLYRTCRVNLQYNDIKCALLRTVNKTGEAKELESEVEADTIFLVMTLSIVSGLIPAILSVFLGSWSDVHGRKPLVVWPLLGQFITSVFVVAFSAMTYLNTWWFVLCALPFAILGGSSTIGLGSNLLIIDTADGRDNSFRLSLLQAFGFVGAVLGTVASNYVYTAVGYVPLFSFSAVIYLVGLLYTILFVEETVNNAISGSFTGIFNFDHLKEMVATCFRSRPTITSIILFLFVSAYGITIFCVCGIGNIDYFFTRQKFQWLLKEYSIFSAVNTITVTFGIFLGMTFLQSVCKMSDGMILILAYLSSISDAICRSLSKKSWQMYLAGTMSMLGGLSSPLIRSQIAKIVSNDEVAKIYSLLSCVEAVLPVFSPIVFSTIYFNTMSLYPGTAYMVSGALFTLCLGFIAFAEILFYKSSLNQNEVSLSRERLL